MQLEFDFVEMVEWQCRVRRMIESFVDKVIFEALSKITVDKTSNLV